MGDNDTTALAVAGAPSRALEATDYALAHLDDLLRLAEQVHRSKLMPKHLDSPSAVLAVILAGRELGMGAMEAARTLYLVDGRVVMAADAQLARAIAAGVRAEWLETTDKVARLSLTRPGNKPHVATYTIEMAQRAGLASRANWKNHTEAMLRARAITAAIRAYCPDVLGSGVYDRDELEAETTTQRPDPVPSREPEHVAAEVVSEVDEAGHHRSWAASKGRWFAALRDLGLAHDDVSAWVLARGSKSKPSGWAERQRDALVAALGDPNHPKRVDLDAWLAQRAAEHAQDEAAMGREPGEEG